jgi:hypothetical protein
MSDLRVDGVACHGTLENRQIPLEELTFLQK